MKTLVSFAILICFGTCSNSFQFPDSDKVRRDRVHYGPGPSREQLDANCGITEEDPKDTRTLTPWNAGIFIEEGTGKWKYLFSGTVIGPSTVVTLGRRFWENVSNNWKLKIPNGQRLLVAVGLKSTNLEEQDSHSQTAQVTYVQPHTKFNEKTRVHDVAIIHLKTPLNLSSPYARAACLPQLSQTDPDGDFFTPGTTAIHGGFDWETRRDGFRDFKVAKIIMQTHESCLQAFRQLESETPFYLSCARVVPRNYPRERTTLDFLLNRVFAGGSLVVEDQSNLCVFYGSTPVIKIGTKHTIVGLNSVFTLTGPNYSCDKKSVNWFSRLNGSIPWITRAINCGPDRWSCGNGNCIGIDEVCDQTADCSDKSDEDPLFCRGLNPCSADEFECGVYDACIAKSSVCDFKVDCQKGEDEEPDGVCSGNYSTSASRGCSAIQQTEGVIIECEIPETKSRADCSSRRHVSLGVRAKLSCAKYYVSSGNRPTVTRQCGKNQSWTPAISFGCHPDCGRAERALNLLIVNGTLTSRDSWPWHVAIFKFNPEEEIYSYICGGSLIHRAGVLTASHCFLSEQFEFLDATRFKIVLAPKSSIYEENLVDPHSQILDILDVYIPESFNTRDFKSDLAILQLRKPVVFNDYIRPVCYPASTTEHKSLENFQLSSNTLGQVIGFGIDESLGISKNLRFANLPVVSTQACFDELKQTPKEDTYCAGYTNGTSVCNGDSGGGMVFQGGTGISPRYYVQGIVSHAPRQVNSVLCNSHSYAVFTRVGFFSEWIEEQIQKIEISL